MVFSIPWRNHRYIPVMEMAKALVNSGNIDLIKSVELRTSIISYLEKTEALLAHRNTDYQHKTMLQTIVELLQLIQS